MNQYRTTPPERPDPCVVCGEPVGTNNEYYDIHDECNDDE